MAAIETTEVFQVGNRQAVRLPEDFHVEGDRVQVRRVGRGVLIEPVTERNDVDWKDVFAKLDRCFGPSFMEDGREQPPMPEDRDYSGFP